MALVGSALVSLGLEAGGLMSGLSAATGALSRFGEGVSVTQGIGVAFAAVGVAAVGMGVASVKAAADFQSGLTSLVTGAGEAQKNIGMVSSGIMDLSTATGTSTSQLVSGMYMIESGGYHGAAGLAILKAAAEGAKVGNADLGVVADATDTVLKNFGDTGLTASQAVNTLIGTVSHGKTTMQDLSASLSQILPTAAAAKIGLNDTMAAMATMTGEGIPAANAATYLRQTILALEAPSTSAKKALADVGLTSAQVSTEMQHSLPGALQMITDAVGKKFPAGSAAYVEAIKNISGGSRTMQGMLDLTGTHLKTLQDNVAGLSASVKSGGNSINGWSDVQKTFNFAMSQASAAVNSVFIAVGTQLLPILTPLVSQVATSVGQFTNWIQTSGVLSTVIHGLVSGVQMAVGFLGNLIAIGSSVVSFFQQNQLAAGLLMVAIGALGGVMTLFAAASVAKMILGLLDFGLSLATSVAESLAGAATMTTTFTTMSGMIVASMGTAAASIMAVAGPFLLVGAIIAGAVAIVIVVIKNWGAISTWLQGAWAGVVGFFQGAMQAIGNAVNGVIGWFNQWKPLILSIGGVILTFLAPALIQTGVNAAIAGAQMLASFVTGLVTSGAAAATSAAGGIAAFIGGLIESGTQAVIAGAKFVAGLIPSIISFAATSISAAATAIPAMIAGFISWAVAGWSAAAATIAATWPILLIIAAVLAFIAIIVLLVTHWNQVVSFLGTVWNAIAGVAKTVWGAISGFFMSVWNGILNFLKAVWNVIFTAAKIIFIIIADVILLPFIPLITFFKTHWAQIQAVLSAAWNMIKSIATTVWNAIIGFFQTIIQGWIIIFTTVWNFISPYLQAIWTTISTVASTIWNAISSFFTTIFTTIQNIVTTVWTAITNFFQMEITGWKIIFTTVWNAITGFLSGVWNGISNTASSIWNNITSTIMGVIHGLQSKLTGAWNTIKNDFSNAFNALSGLAQGAWNDVQGAVKGGINAVIGLINGMINGVNNISSKVGLPSIPTIPYLARGGTNLGGGLYVVGDAGPEILQLPGGSSVYPMSSFSPSVTPSVSSTGGGNGDIYLQIYLDSTEMTNQLGGKIIKKVLAHGPSKGWAA